MTMNDDRITCLSSGLGRYGLWNAEMHSVETDIASSRTGQCWGQSTGIKHAFPPIEASPSGSIKSCVPV